MFFVQTCNMLGQVGEGGEGLRSTADPSATSNTNFNKADEV